MKIIAFLACAFLIACAVDPSTSVSEQRSTTCVSTPIVAGGDGDPGDGIVAQCPPPTPAWVFAAVAPAATSSAQTLYPAANVPQEAIQCSGDDHGECWGTLWTPAGNIAVRCAWNTHAGGSVVVSCSAEWGSWL